MDLDGYKAESTQTSSSIWIRDIEDINGNKLFPEINDIDVINSGKVFPTATYIDGTKNLIGHKKDGQIIIKYNGQEQILNQEGNKNKYEQNKATNAIFFNKDGKAHLDIHMLNKLFGFEDLADYVFICPEIRADVEKAIAARETEKSNEQKAKEDENKPIYISYLSEEYVHWLKTAEGLMLYPFLDEADNIEAKSRKNVTLGIGFTFDAKGSNWYILKDVLGWTDEEILSIANGVYSGTNYKNSKYEISEEQFAQIFTKITEGIYMPNVNKAIEGFNNQNGYITTYSQQELEAIFDFAYNTGLSPTSDTGWAYSSSINDTEKIIYYYLRKDKKGAIDAIKRYGKGERRRLNQMNLFFFQNYDFLDKSGESLDPLRDKLGF